MIAFDTDAALAFLADWQPGGPWLLTAIDPDTEVIQTRTFRDPTAARRWINGWQGKRNLYFSVNQPKADIAKKASKADIGLCLALHVDLDPPGGADPTEIKLELIGKLRSYRNQPTAIIDSGGGAQGFWRLREPAEINGPESIAKCESYNRALETALGGDHCHNVDRVMRLPGTVNLPNAKKREKGRVVCLARVVEADWSRRYDLADFDPADDILAARESKKPNGSASPDAEPPQDLDAIIARLPDWVVTKLKDPTSERSDNLASCYAMMFKLGLDDATVARIVHAFPGGIGAKFTRSDGLLKDIARFRAKSTAHAPGRERQPGDDTEEVWTPPAASEPPWPVMEAEAYQGRAGEIVDAIEPITEADPAALLVQLLVAIGNAVGHRAHCLVGNTRHHANLFAVICGTSSKGRKGTSWDPIEYLLNLADPDWVTACVKSGLSSGEGIVHAVHDDIWVREKVPQGGKGKPPVYQTVLKEPAIADKRLFVIEPEFANALAMMNRPGNSLSPVMRLAWDGRRLQTLTKHSAESATGAHVSVVAHITVAEFRNMLDDTAKANGFANRFLLVMARRSKLLPFPGRIEAEAADRFARLLHEIASNTVIQTEITFHPEAAALWQAEYETLSAEQPGLFGAIVARAEAQVLRLALVYALSDERRQIQPHHLRAAVAVWRYCEASARYVFGDAVGDPTADTILAALRQAGGDGLTRTEISNLFGRNKSSEQISRALALLVKAAKAHMSRTGGGPGAGGPIERWLAV